VTFLRCLRTSRNSNQSFQQQKSNTLFKIEVLLTASPELLAVLSVIAGMSTSAKKSAPSDGGSQAKTKEEAKKIVAGATPVGGDKEEKPAVEITLAQVRDAVQKVTQSGKREEAKALLTEFGSPKVTDLAPEQYTDFLTKLKAL
jgi:hypothetical protein